MGLWRNRSIRLFLGALLLGLFMVGCMSFGSPLAISARAQGQGKGHASGQAHILAQAPEASEGAAAGKNENGAKDSEGAKGIDTAGVAQNNANNAKPKVVLILTNGTTLEEYSADNTPHIYNLMKKGSTALMNTRPAGSRNTPNAYATIGAGIHVVSSGFAGDAFNTGDTDGISAGISYIARTGMEPPKEGVVTLGISQIMRANEAADIMYGPGRMGDVLNAAELKTAVVGNGDIEDEFNRDVVTIAMDKWGRVDYGDVSRDLLVKVPHSALGYQTDYEKLYSRFIEMYGKADFIVVETGDTYRAEELADSVFPEIMAGEKRIALSKADAFVGRVLESVDLENTMIIVTSPHPSKAGLKINNYMTPLIVYGGGAEPSGAEPGGTNSQQVQGARDGRKTFDAGFLTSGTTRRQGVVANTDIFPTVLEFFGLDIPAGTEGRVLETVPVGTVTNGQRVDTEGTVINTLAQMNSDMVFVYNARPVLVKGYVGLQIIVMVLVIAIMVLWPHFLKFLRPGLLWLMAVPLSLLLIGGLRFVSLPLYTLIAIVVAALVVIGAYTFGGKRDLDLFIIIGLVTVVAVLADVATGSTLIKNSTLGYDPMAGSRYYGIGNEFMGVVIGASIIAISSMWEKYCTRGGVQRATGFGQRATLGGLQTDTGDMPRSTTEGIPYTATRSRVQGKPRSRWLEVLTLAFLVVIIVIMAAPQLGTNVGGTIAAVAAFSFTFLVLKGVKVRIKQLVAIGAGVTLVIVALAIFDMNRDVEAQSHLGRFANNIASGGFPVLVDMFRRKIEMNIKLMRYTIWSRVFLAMLAALMVSFYRPVGLMQKVRKSHPYIFRGLLGILVGAFVALIVNDSGIVAAATMMIFGMAPLIYLMGREREQDFDRGSGKRRIRLFPNRGRA